MTRPNAKGQSQQHGEAKQAPFTPSSSSAKAAQSAAIARWLEENPGQEYWNPAARMGSRVNGGLASTV